MHASSSSPGLPFGIRQPYPDRDRLHTMVASPSDTADTLIAGSQNLQDPPGAMVAPLHDDALELPGYLTNASPQRSADRTEHTYSLENSKARKWLVLTVKSRAANATSLPTYYEKDIISGRVELDLDTPETIKGIFVTVSPSLYLFTALLDV